MGNTNPFFILFFLTDCQSCTGGDCMGRNRDMSDTRSNTSWNIMEKEVRT